jgi:hypothetical protein
MGENLVKLFEDLPDPRIESETTQRYIGNSNMCSNMWSR